MGILQKYADDGTGSASEVTLLSFVTTGPTVIKRVGINVRGSGANGIYRLKVGSVVISEIFAKTAGAYERNEQDGLVRVESGATVTVTMEQGTISAASAEVSGSSVGSDNQDI